MARHVPIEFDPQRAIHTLWPWRDDLWPDRLTQARIEFAQFLRLVAEPGDDGARTPIVIQAANAASHADAKARCGDFASIHRAAYGDVWARDTGPVFAKSGAGLKAVRFGFNGWGGKFLYEDDQEIGAAIASLGDAEPIVSTLICEGGALEFDGAGTLLTTRDVVLNPNRNPGLTEAQFEAEMARLFGIERVIWLERGLVGDHTDGHIDNIARFIAPGRVVCQHANGSDDPNREVFEEIETNLKTAGLDVVSIPSPGRVELEHGSVDPASHMNWVVGARNLVMPVYNGAGERAAQVLQDALKSHEVVASPSRTILSGGGSFHCVTCNQPA